MFWNKKSQLGSDEYEDLVKKIIKVVADIDIHANRLTLLSSDIRKLRVELRMKAKELEELQDETNIKDDRQYI